MKIAYLITRMDEYGGAQIHVRDLCRWLHEKGHEPFVMAGRSGRVSDELQEDGIDYIELPALDRPIRPLQDMKAFFRIRRALKKYAPDLLSCHSSKAGFIGRLAAKSAGVPAIFTAHGWAFTEGVPRKKRFVYKWIEKIAALFSKHIITVSDYDRELALKEGVARRRRITTVHNGMPQLPSPDKEPKAIGETVRFLMVARFGPQKDHKTLLKALASLKDKNWRLDLAGIGDDSAMRKLAEAEGVADRIRFLGERDDIPRLMLQADVYCLISHWEGFPRSILEAMRASLSVVATDVAGVSEAVIDGRTGYLVPPRDVAALTEVLRKTVADPARIVEMGRAGREVFVNHFTFETMAQRTLKIYEEVAE